jgi:hypothetical protein
MTKKKLGINLTKKVKDLYDENQNTDERNYRGRKTGKISHVHGLQELTLPQRPHSSKQ